MHSNKKRIHSNKKPMHSNKKSMHSNKKIYAFKQKNLCIQTKNLRIQTKNCAFKQKIYAFIQEIYAFKQKIYAFEQKISICHTPSYSHINLNKVTIKYQKYPKSKKIYAFKQKISICHTPANVIVPPTHHASYHDVGDLVVGPDGEHIVAGFALALPHQKTPVPTLVQHELLGVLTGQLPVEPSASKQPLWLVCIDLTYFRIIWPEDENCVFWKLLHEPSAWKQALWYDLFIYLTYFRIIWPEDENCVFESLRYEFITKNYFYYGSCPDIHITTPIPKTSTVMALLFQLDRGKLYGNFLNTGHS